MAVQQTKGLSRIALILMIFTSVFGFTNMPRAFYLMGYSAIPWYVLAAFLFFIPYAFMMSEFGAAFRTERGGMYSWMEKSVGGKYAFVGTFMWYASYLIWMVNVASGLWVVLSNAIFGEDQTQTWSLLGLSSVETLGVLGICWILFVTAIGSRGLGNISKVTSVGGTAVALLNVVLLGGGMLVFALQGHLAQPMPDVVQAFTVSPMEAYQSSVGVLGFLTFAIFAYGGLEAVGGLVDQTENPEKNFPKGVLISAIIISIGYAIGIWACGMFTNWQAILGVPGVHLGNVAYVLMHNLGYQMGAAMGASPAICVAAGEWMARFVGISMFLALTGAFFTLTYSPLKTLIEGAPADIWPGKLGVLKHDMPVYAMYVQAAIVCTIIAFVSFGGSNASQFFQILTLMTNVAMTVPYMFLALAFIKFKQKQLAGTLPAPFMIYKTQGIATTAALVVTFVIGFANVFTVIQPLMEGPAGLRASLTMLSGPVIFTVLAYVLYCLYEKKHSV